MTRTVPRAYALPMKQLAAWLTLVVSSVILAAPAHATIPRNVHDGRSGVVDAGWVRALCATSDDGVRCALRFPVVFSHIDMRYVVAGEQVAAESTFFGRQYPTRGRVTGTPSINRRVVEGVRLVCSAQGSTADCALIVARARDIRVNHFIAGRSTYGYDFRA